MSEFDIFNLGVEEMNFHEKEERKRVLYSPSYKDGKDNTYSAIIRFIPNPEDPINKSISQKYTYWLDEPSVNVRGYFDSAQSVGGDCPMAKTYWKLAKSESAVDQANAKKLNRKEQYHSLVYIIKDPQNEELEGTVQIFRYNKTIKALIDEQRNPDTELGAEEPVNVFDLFKGKDFLLKITHKGGYPDYTGCKFGGKVSSITIDGNPVEKSKEGMALIKEKVLDVAPDLSAYDYKPLTQDQTSQVYTFIATLTNDTSHLSGIVSQAGTSKAAAPTVTADQAVEDMVANESTSESTADDFDEFNLDGKSENAEAPAAETTAASADNELDDFLNDL